MAKTPSNMIPLGTVAPTFNLLDTVSNKMLSLNTLRSDIATVIIFICNHCPYVTHIREKLVDIAKEYQAKGISFIAISSNDVSKYPSDGPEQMHYEAKTHGYPFPYLYDETQDVAKAYQAACTPDIYVFDKNMMCVYRGRFDNSTPGNSAPVTGKDLTTALNKILMKQPVDDEQFASIGCNIKWKS